MRNAALLAVLAIAACATNAKPGNDKDVISNSTGDWEATLSPLGNSTVRGSVKAQSAVLGTGVHISISGATLNANHPWHIHRGQCGDNGAIVGDASAYPVLTAGNDGNASVNTTLKVALLENEHYYVNVHRSQTDLAPISCGNLSND